MAIGDMFAWRTFPSTSGSAPGAYLTIPALARRGVRVAFTTRHGGYSTDPYAELNLSYSSGDAAERVRQNRARVVAALGGELLSWTGARQIHSATVRRAGLDERGAGWDSPRRVIPDADALWTDTPDVAVVVLAADCTPILLADANRRRIAVIHAGWRGLLAGIVQQTVDAMGSTNGLAAFVGPSIGPCCYEVRPDVADPAAATFGEEVVRSHNGRLHLDLWSGSLRALAQAGVAEAWPAALCTRCEPTRFYSHRAGARGRQGLIARLNPE